MKHLLPSRSAHREPKSMTVVIAVIIIVAVLPAMLLLGGIVAGVAIPAMLSQRVAAIDSSVESDVKNAATQVETWMVSNDGKEVPSFVVEANEDGAVKNTAKAKGLSEITADQNTTLTIKPVPGGPKDDYAIIGSNPNGKQSEDNPDTPDVQEGIIYYSGEGIIQE